MFAWLTNRLRRSAARLRMAVVTPVGPGHSALYAECRASVAAAWRHSHGPFSALSYVAVDDGDGGLGRSRARNIGIERALQEGADWLFFLDADDLMVEGAFAAVAPFIAGHDAVWGLILGLSPGAARPHLRIPQIVTMNSLDDLLLFDPFLTLQMGHFVRAPVAQALRFDETLDAGEDFDYYLRLWSRYRGAKVAREFFINRHAHSSIGPRAASAGDWGAAVRGRQRVERERRGLAADSAAAREIGNARAAELQLFCRQHGLVNAQDSIALSAQMPYYGTLDVNEYEGGAIVLKTDNDDAICAQLAWTGEYQPFAAALWQSVVASGGAVVDAGAGNGLYALLAARVAPQVRIICFEPVAENLARARINVELNCAGNIEFVEAAAADFAGPAFLHLRAGEAMLPLHGEIGAASGRSTQCLRIDDWLAQAAVGAVAAVRISAGNGTLDVLRGMMQTLTHQRPDLLVDLPDPSAAGALAEMLQPPGYRSYVIDNAARELTLLEAGRTRLPQGELQVLASARAASDISRIAGAAMGRLRVD